MTAAAAHCLELVRSHDKDRFLAALFAPDAARPHLLALYAFNVEVSRIRESVSEPRIGLIRLQWWRDTLDATFAGNTSGGHPVAEALAGAIAAGSLPSSALHDLLTAHEFDLFSDPVASLTQLEGYLGETSSRLIQMAAMILDRDQAAKSSEAAGLAGVAHGLTLLLGQPSRRGQFLPPGLSLEAAIDHARQRLQQARDLLPGLAKPLLPAFLPVGLTSLYLDRIATAPDRPLTVSQFRRQLSLWWHARREDF